MEKERFGCLEFIPGCNQGKYPFCNSIFVNDEISAVIDPASDETALRELARTVKPQVIINSHYHEDHFTCNYLFPAAELYVHEADAPCFTSLRNLLDAYGLSDPLEIELWSRIMLETFHFQERVPDRRLRDGEVLDFGQTRLTVIHTPGHTPGHCAFFCAEEGVLFTGDLDMTSFGPWYGDRVSDIGSTIASVNRLLDLPARTYITSHNMGIIRDDFEALARAYVDIIHQREEKIVGLLDRPSTIAQIADQWPIYKKAREPLAFYQFGERGMVGKHLEYLVRQGRAAETEGRYFLTG